MSEQDKKRQRIYDLLKAETKPKIIIGVFLCIPLSLDLYPVNYAALGFLENKINSIPHVNIGFLQTAIEEEWIVWVGLGFMAYQPL